MTQLFPTSALNVLECDYEWTQFVLLNFWTHSKYLEPYNPPSPLVGKRPPNFPMLLILNYCRLGFIMLAKEIMTHRVSSALARMRVVMWKELILIREEGMCLQTLSSSSSLLGQKDAGHYLLLLYKHDSDSIIHNRNKCMSLPGNNSKFQNHINPMS